MSCVVSFFLIGHLLPTTCAATIEAATPPKNDARLRHRERQVKGFGSL